MTYLSLAIEGAGLGMELGSHTNDTEQYWYRYIHIDDWMTNNEKSKICRQR